jgi:short-subunit dehydrogenase
MLEIKILFTAFLFWNVCGSVAVSNLWKLPDKSTAVVTGGTKGIGHAIVTELGTTFGCKILTCARNGDELDACIREWRSQGIDVRGVVADVSTSEVRFTPKLVY